MTGEPVKGDRHHEVAIVGSGFAGIGMAAGLLRAGQRDLVVFERAGEVGGTWRDNTYPGAACDVPSNLYSFSFAPNPDWSRSFSPQPEIEAYLDRCADRFGVRPHIRFDHEVTAAAWDNDAQRWEIETTHGRYTATVLVSARGPLSEPAVPPLAGLDRFTGTLFHSARWDHGHSLAGERVAVIGTGASAIQFVPRIQPEVGKLSLFQRTPAWVIPRRDRDLTDWEHRLFRAAPPLQQAVRGAVYWGREAYTLGFIGNRRRRLAGRLPEVVARRHLATQVRDPALRAALTPHYEIGCKRILISNDFYPALCQPNVEVVTDSVAEVRPRSIVTADGTERPIDTIVLGTGFDVTGNGAANATRGRNGQLLAEAWTDRMAAYKGTTVAGFPNLFLMVGPNSGLGHTSIVFMIESQIAYVLGALAHMQRHGISSVDVREEAQDGWTRHLDERSQHTVWTEGGCRSYYLDDRGRNVAIWPGSSWSFRQAVRWFDPAAYHRTPAPSSSRPAPATMGDPQPAEASENAPGAADGILVP